MIIRLCESHASSRSLMVHKILVSTVLTLCGWAAIGFSWTQPSLAALPPGNAVKDPYAILRNALPIESQ